MFAELNKSIFELFVKFFLDMSTQDMSMVA